ncbi:MAG: two-component system, NarL family, nitrate/nitrite response regulator NarL [Chloroflexota bacterium]|jgi:DNA-binding NarL/FixJ family response regulator|nr:two-component system, NarL family, nitrate/nitrite response regulator NarL [Chloroflexota bacterium]
MSLRALVVDDHPLYRRGLVDALTSLLGLIVSGQAGSVSEALDQPIHPDVVLLDLGLPVVAGAHAVEAILRRWPAAHVLVLTASESRQSLVAALTAGASGYLTKHAGEEELAEAIAKVARGELFVTPRLAAYLLEEERLAPLSEWPLSGREREILRLVAEGERDRDIADRLCISLKTVQSHLSRIRDKTSRRRRAELTRFAIEAGLVDNGHGRG